MSKKLTILTLALLAMFAANGFAVDKNLTTSGDWNTGTNWTPTGVPAVGDKAIIMGDAIGAAGATIAADVNIGTTGSIVVGNGGTDTAKLTINGGNIISGPLTIGSLSNGIFNFNNGTWNNATTRYSWNIGTAAGITGVVNFANGTAYTGDLILRATGTQVNVNSGKLDVGNDIEVHTGAVLNINGGTVEQTTIAFGYAPGNNAAELLIENGASINITGTGKLILNGDATAAITGYVNVMGVIASNGDPKKIYWDYNVTTPLKTTVWAQATQRNDNYVDTELLYSNFGTDAFDLSAWTTTTNPPLKYIGSNVATEIAPGTTGWAFQATNTYKEQPIDTLVGYNTVGSTAIILDFWFKDHALTSNGTDQDKNSIKLKLIDGVTNTVVDNINLNFWITKDQWTHITYYLTKSDYMRASLKVRFNINYMQTGDLFGLDEFRLIVRKPAQATPTAAALPNPVNGNPYIKTRKVLSWQAGYLAASHDVYLGTNLAVVTNATKTTTGVYKTTTTDVTYTPTTELAYNTTYYWRIDENYTGASNPPSGTLKGEVWSFKTMASATVVEPNLIGWWKMDDLTGVWDASGNEQVGKYVKEAAIVDDPNSGRALSLDGTDDAVNLTGCKGVLGTHARTVTAMIKTPKTITQSFVSWGDNNAANPDGQKFEVALNASGLPRVDVEGAIATGTTKINDNLDWQFVAVTLSDAVPPTTNKIKIYVNSVLETMTFTGGTKPINTLLGPDVRLGSYKTFDYFRGLIKDVRIYDRELSEAEIGALIPHNQAWGESPKNDPKWAKPVAAVTPALTWKKGDTATNHDVYFGTDPNAVRDATKTASFGTYKITLPAATTTYSPTGLKLNTTYYWRIDEIKTTAPQSEYKGKVWTFKTANYISIDDMESYNVDTMPINVTPPGWGDNTYNNKVGGDATIGLTPDVHGGKQSLQFYYNNYDPDLTMYFCSEVVKVFTDPQDWSFANTGVKILTIPFRGKASNANDRVYAAVEDSFTKVGVVYYQPGAVDLQDETWKVWQINLNDFTLNASGVNLSKIKKLYFGVGTFHTQDIPNDAYEGTLYIDDVTVNPPACRPEISKPDGDISNDCIVSWPDVRSIANNWLIKDIPLTPAPLGTENLQVRWTFDNGDAADSSGHAIDGNVVSVTAVDDATRGNKVMSFTGTGTISMPENALASITDEITICMWQNGDTTQPLTNSILYADGGAADPNRILNVHLPWSTGSIIFDGGYGTNPNDPNDHSLYDRVSQPADAANQYKNKWNHWAFTKNTTTGEMKMYLNGQLFKSNSGKTRPITGIVRFHLGSNPNSTTNNYKGKIDDFRIYNKVLTEGQVVSAAGITVIAVNPAVNLQTINGTPQGVPGQEIIDYKDLAFLGRHWMEQKLWP